MPQRTKVAIQKAARPFTDQDWNRILKLRVGIPAARFPFVLKRVGRQLFRLSENVYGVVWDLGHIKDDSPPKTPRVARIFWAKNAQAARLIGYHHPQIDRARLADGTASPPPALLQGKAASWANGDTFRAARKDRSGVAERAEYNFRGEFKFKIVWLCQLQIYYASRLRREAELPIAVEIVLQHKHPNP